MEKNDKLEVFKGEDAWYVREEEWFTRRSAFDSSNDAETVFEKLSILNPYSDIYFRGRDVFDSVLNERR